MVSAPRGKRSARNTTGTARPLKSSNRLSRDDTLVSDHAALDTLMGSQTASFSPLQSASAHCKNNGSSFASSTARDHRVLAASLAVSSGNLCANSRQHRLQRGSPLSHAGLPGPSPAPPCFLQCARAYAKLAQFAASNEPGSRWATSNTSPGLLQPLISLSRPRQALLRGGRLGRKVPARPPAASSSSSMWRKARAPPPPSPSERSVRWGRERKFNFGPEP
mmetsp:Transcript_113737/g.317669  ORF Transcript_113737/g.317669 Transcript_113737/m.317669 type:complete len:221 (-) Transcript_113737:15-677(-)